MPIRAWRFVLQLCIVRFLGTFLSDPTDVPHNVVVTLASQLNIADWTVLSRYREGEMRYDHVHEIMAEYGYQDFASPPEHFRCAGASYFQCAVTCLQAALAGSCINPDTAQRVLLETLLEVPGGEQQTPLDRLRQGATWVIPTCDLKNNLEVREIRHGFHVLLIISDLVERVTQNSYQDIKRRENTIMEMFDVSQESYLRKPCSLLCLRI